MYEDIRFSAENAVILWALEQYDKCMKKWQKISGCIILGLGAVIELLFVSNALLDLKYIVEPCDNEDIIEKMYLNIDVLSCAMWINYFVALGLFIYLCRKEKSNTHPSPIRIISTEKITFPFIFEKTYCRLGVITDGSGIERMEAYFVQHDKTAICYKNYSFSQVLINDTKHDRYDKCEINTGCIISIRATTGLAHHIVKLADERLIVFEVLPKGYGELYEKFTIIAPSDDKYSGYLEDYEQGKEIDF